MSTSFLHSILPFRSLSNKTKKSYFRYSQLLPLEIRLLELQPGSPEDPLSGTILQRQLAPGNRQIPDYEALSYSWGDQSDPDTINLTAEQQSSGKHPESSVNSGCLEIGPNLASALRSLRHHDRSRILWCDSVCINQKDVTERSAQVQRMQDVYRWAKRVVIWLGPGTSWSRKIMTTLLSLANQMPRKDRISTSPDWIKVPHAQEPSPVTHDELLAFEKLLALDWHRRLWTLQEVAFANQETSIVRFGDEEALWNEFKDAVVFICIRLDNVLEQHDLVDPFACLRNIEAFLHKALAGSESRDLTEWAIILRMTSCYDCSDDRDRLYAIRGFLTPEIAQTIPVDYGKSAKQILASACVAHITHNGSLRFLELCNSDILPTWTADLGKPVKALSLTNSASARSAASAVLVKSGILEVAGISCDEISSTPILLHSMGLPLSDDEYMVSVIRFLRHLTGKEDFYKDDECLNELIDMLQFGSLWDHDIVRTRSPPDDSLMSLENARESIRRFITHEVVEQSRAVPLVNVDKLLACSRTRNGTFARVPVESRPGDMIVTLLGLDCNLVLRRQRKRGYFKVIGPSYHPRLSHGQALLGDDLKGWKWLWSDDTLSAVFWKEGQRLRLSDPRLDGIRLPKGYFRHRIPTGNDGEEFQTWLYKGPDKESMRRKGGLHDPRMSEDELKKRGIPIQRFRLI